MRTPKELTGEALGYWKRNAKHCVAMGTLTEADRDTFVLLCLTWAKLQTAENESAHNFVCLAARFTALADRFGLNRLSRGKLKLAEPNAPTDEKDEFGL